MNTAGFVFLVMLLAAYVVLDGYDLGIGALHVSFMRTREERSASFALIGPYWNGNEVLLIAAGALLFALFPRVYAAAFSGFYLPLIVVLWLLMARGMSIELRSSIPGELWRTFWDAGFAGSSILLALVFGLSLGNIVRGLPLDPNGYFTGTFGLLLNAYGLSVALFALVALALHGAAFAAWRMEGETRLRAVSTANRLWWVVTAVFIAVSVQTFFITRPHGGVATWVLAAVSVAGLAGIRLFRSDLGRFTSSSIFLAALVGTAAATIFPFLLPAFGRAGGLGIDNGGGNAISLTTALAAAGIGAVGAAIYGTAAARRMLRRLSG